MIRVTLREIASLVSLMTGVAAAAIGWALGTDFRGFTTSHATRTVRGSTILFPTRLDDDERIAAHRLRLAIMGWGFVVVGGLQTMSGLYIALFGFAR